MFKNIMAFAVAMALACSAHATSFFDFEADVGGSMYGKVDGRWINEGLPNDPHYSAPAWSARVILNAVDYHGGYTPGLALNLVYLNYGRASIRSLAAPDEDPNVFNATNGGFYDTKSHSCQGPCGPLRDFSSGGTMQAIALTLEPYWTTGAWRFGIEVGPALFRYTWDATATSTSTTPYWGPAGSVETWHHDPRWELGAVAGVSVCRDSICARANYIYSPPRDKVAPGAGNGAFMLTLGYTW
jgi:hypothetical protein